MTNLADTTLSALRAKAEAAKNCAPKGFGLHRYVIISPDHLLALLDALEEARAAYKKPLRVAPKLLPRP